MNAQNKTTNLATKAIGWGCQQGDWFLTWVRTLLLTAAFTFALRHVQPHTQLRARRSLPFIKCWGYECVEFDDDNNTHSFTHSHTVRFDIKHKERFLSWWEHFLLDTMTPEVQTTTVSDNVAHHSTSDKLAHPGRTMDSRHANWHIREVSTHARGF